MGGGKVILIELKIADVPKTLDPTPYGLVGMWANWKILQQEKNLSSNVMYFSNENEVSNVNDKLMLLSDYDMT